MLACQEIGFWETVCSFFDHEVRLIVSFKTVLSYDTLHITFTLPVPRATDPVSIVLFWSATTTTTTTTTNSNSNNNNMITCFIANVNKRRQGTCDRTQTKLLIRDAAFSTTKHMISSSRCVGQLYVDVLGLPTCCNLINTNRNNEQMYNCNVQ